MLLDFLRRKNRCNHRNFSPFNGGSYCPDCGKEIEFSWILLRCRCCNSKRKATVAFNSIVPLEKFCVKCGGAECFIEKKESPEFFDVPYAIISKREVNESVRYGEVLQIWVEKVDETPPARRFLPLLNTR